MDEYLYVYMKFYVKYFYFCFVVSGVDNIFIKDNGKGLRKGIIGRRVGEVFRKVDVR